MRAAAYQRSEPVRCCICDSAPSSMTRNGCVAASIAKKKSGPWPAQAVPSFRSLASKVAVIAFCRPEGLDFASSINCRADNLSTAYPGATRQRERTVTFHMTRYYTLAGVRIVQEPHSFKPATLPRNTVTEAFGRVNVVCES